MHRLAILCLLCLCLTAGGCLESYYNSVQSSNTAIAEHYQTPLAVVEFKVADPDKPMTFSNVKSIRLEVPTDSRGPKVIIPESPGSQAAKAVSAMVPVIMTHYGSEVLIKTSEHRRDENTASQKRPTTYIGGDQTTVGNDQTQVGGNQRNDQGDNRDWRDDHQDNSQDSRNTSAPAASP
ncbi:MAG: hypothetical protein PVG03_18160 [Desulfarculaceae bacterium]